MIVRSVFDPGYYMHFRDGVCVCVCVCVCVGTKLTNSINSKYESLRWGTALYPRSLREER